MTKRAAVACSVNMGNLLVGACGSPPKKVVGCWDNVTCKACLSVWGDRDPQCPCLGCQVTRTVKGKKPIELDEVGVVGSMVRRVIALMESCWYELELVEGVDHPSRTVLRFDAGLHGTVITYEDVEK